MNNTLPETDQKAVLADIDARQKANRKNAAKNFALAAAGFAGCLVLNLMLPPLVFFVPAIPALATGFVGLLGFNRLMQNVARERVLKDIAGGVKQEGFAEKLTGKLAGVTKNFFRTRNTFDALFLGSCALLFATVLTPLEAPAAVIVAGFAAAAAVSTVYNWAFGARWATVEAASSIEKITGITTAPQKPAPAKHASGLSLVTTAPAPGPAFGLAAVAPTEKTPVVPIEPAPAAPKLPGTDFKAA